METEPQMISVLLVDDQDLVRIGLRTLLENEAQRPSGSREAGSPRTASRSYASAWGW
jgi:DNA-binding NarL/FixJ family response regulator